MYRKFVENTAIFFDDDDDSQAGVDRQMLMIPQTLRGRYWITLCERCCKPGDFFSGIEMTLEFFFFKSMISKEDSIMCQLKA